MANQTFTTLVVKYFEFLISKYGFQQARILKKHKGNFVMYSHDDTGIIVEWEWKDRYVMVWLCKLADTTVKKQRWQNYVINRRVVNEKYDMDDLIGLKDSDAIVSIDFFFTEAEFEAYIAALAVNLDNYAEEFLQGDFSMFPKLKEVVQKRAQQLNR